MSFQGADPYGTPGGIDNALKPTTPADIRVSQTPTLNIFLRVNNPVFERLRENIEDVVRVLGLSGDTLVGVLVRDEGTVIDDNVRDIDFLFDFDVSIAGSVVFIAISPLAIDTNLINTGAGTLAKVGALQANTSKFADGTILPTDFDNTQLTEFVQDVLGVTLIDTTSVDVTYNDVGNSFSAVLLFAGSGVASTASRSDHTHTATVVQRIGSNGTAPFGTTSQTTNCIAGEQVVGCGFDVASLPGIAGQDHPVMCKPVANGCQSTWQAGSGGSTTLTTYTLCMEQPIA